VLLYTKRESAVAWLITPTRFAIARSGYIDYTCSSKAYVASTSRVGARNTRYTKAGRSSEATAAIFSSATSWRLPQNITTIAISIEIKDNVIYASSVTGGIGDVRTYYMVGFGRQVPHEKK
tara:strand:+ start:522 stop:884 length:363 start_codon:yes stop_codon:yes gene_type:complete